MTKRTLSKDDANDANEVAAVWVPRNALHVWAQNPRKNDGEPVRKVMESIRRFGFAAPIVARTNGEVIAGHTRLKAAEALGLDRVPVRYLDLDPAEARLLALADNRLNEEAEWDFQALTEILREVADTDAGLLAFTGFDTHELEPLLRAEWTPPTPDDSVPDNDPHEPLDADTRTLKLSEGQWQRVAAAVAMMKRSEGSMIPDAEVVAKLADWYVESVET
jgi:hypothetical protein